MAIVPDDAVMIARIEPRYPDEEDEVPIFVFKNGESMYLSAGMNENHARSQYDICFTHALDWVAFQKAVAEIKA